MFDSAPNFYLFGTVIAAAYILTAMFLNLVREECPNVYKEISGPSDMFAGVAGPFHLGLTYILPLDYESWGLSQTATWLGRVLFLVNVSYLIIILWGLVSLFYLAGNF